MRFQKPYASVHVGACDTVAQRLRSNQLTADRITSTWQMWIASDILRSMNLMMRSATLQMRVPPALKYASEQVFQRIGLSMTEAVELFLRRAVLDERLPFEVVALNGARLAQIAQDYEQQLKLLKTREKGEKRGTPGKKNLKSSFGGRTPSGIRAKTTSKRERI